MLILHMKLMLPKSSQHSAEYLLFVWLYTVEFNRLPFPNDKMYDDVVFADRFRYSLTSSGNRVWIGLPRLLYVHIAYEIDSAKISAAFCRISYCLYDLYGWIQSTAVFKRQNLRWCSFRWSIPLSIDYVWESSIDSVITTPSCSLLHAHIAYVTDTFEIIAAFCLIFYCLHYLIRLNSNVCHVQTTRDTII